MRSQPADTRPKAPSPSRCRFSTFHPPYIVSIFSKHPVEQSLYASRLLHHSTSTSRPETGNFTTSPLMSSSQSIVEALRPFTAYVPPPPVIRISTLIISLMFALPPSQVRLLRRPSQAQLPERRLPLGPHHVVPSTTRRLDQDHRASVYRQIRTLERSCTEGGGTLCT